MGNIKTIYFIFFVFIFFSCSSVKYLVIEQKISMHKPIILLFNKDNEPSYLRVPISLIMKNKSYFNKIEFNYIMYGDKSTSVLRPSQLYEVIGDSISLITDNNYRVIKPKKQKKFIHYIKHKIVPIQKKEFYTYLQEASNSKKYFNENEIFVKKHIQTLKEMFSNDTLGVKARVNGNLKNIKRAINIEF